MEIGKKTAHCSCCNNNCEMNYGIENYDMSKLDKENYSNYKDIYVYKCPKCGFISTDISGDDVKLYNLYKGTTEFQNALRYRYLKGYNLIPMYDENWSAAYPVYNYDPYAIMYSNSPDTEFKLRTLNKAIELKENMKQRYLSDWYESHEEGEDEKDHNILQNLIKKNLIISCEKFITIAKSCDDLNVFLQLMLVENLYRIGNNSEAKKLYNLIKQKYTLSDDLKEYFEILKYNKESK